MAIAPRLPLQSIEPVVWFARVRLALAVAALASSLVFDVPLHNGMLAYYETLFAVAALCCGLFVARLRTAESAARLRARDLSRRTLEAEAQVRRSLANSIHDGPVQELIGLDLVLASVDQ